MTDHKPFHESCWLITYWMFNNSVIRALDPDNPRDRAIIHDLQDRRPAPEIAVLHYTEQAAIESFPDASFDNEEDPRSRSRKRRSSSKGRTKLVRTNRANSSK